MTSPLERIATRPMKLLDLFSCIGCHSIGMHRAGVETVAMCESNSSRRAILSRHFPGMDIHDDICTFTPKRGEADIVMGGPPCQKTSVSAAIHGRRTGESLWPEMLRVALAVGPEWVVVEQPSGNAEWEANVAQDLDHSGYHVARAEFSAGDVGAPYQRRRVFIIACTSLSRLEVAWRSIPSQIDRVARAADAGDRWGPDKLGALRVDARSAGEMDRNRSRVRVERIEALGDSNPPEMSEVIGRAIMAAA